MILQQHDTARGWVNVGQAFDPRAADFVLRGAAVLAQHANVLWRVKDDAGRVALEWQDGRWVKPHTGGVWRASGWLDLPGFEDTVARRP